MFSAMRPTERYFITEKDQNKLQILSQIMDSQEISATEVSEKTALSAATVSRVFKELRQKKLVLFLRKDKTEKGRNPDLYTFNWEYGFMIHYYITNKAIYGYLANLSGTVIQKTSVEFTSQAALDDVFSIIKGIKTKFAEKIQNRQGKILVAGFSLPGVINEESRTIYTIPDVEQLNNIKFYDYAERVLEVPVIANNVSWLSAVGEKTRAYPFANSLVYMVFTNIVGIGAGIIYKNELVKGGMHYAGEIGQTWFDHNYSLEEYMQGKGLFEHTASIQHVFKGAEKLLKENKAPILKEVLGENPDKKFSLHLLEEAAKKGDKEIQKILDDAIRMWAGMIININFIINPEFIVLGGCMSTENQYIFNVLNKYLKKMKYFQPSVRLSVSGEDAQLLGGLQILKEYVNNTIIFKEAIR
jgi:predicted NBD/HSP70 family sugar kinase